jgi:hypothetical protein
VAGEANSANFERTQNKSNPFPIVVEGWDWWKLKFYYITIYISKLQKNKMPCGGLPLLKYYFSR